MLFQSGSHTQVPLLPASRKLLRKDVAVSHYVGVISGHKAFRLNAIVDVVCRRVDYISIGTFWWGFDSGPRSCHQLLFMASCPSSL